MEALERSIVRIFRQSSQTVVGSGFLITKRHILTCSHVVLSADGGKAADISETLITFEFPFLMPNIKYSARVFYLSSVDEGGEDLAVLELLQPPPLESSPARLIDVEKGYSREFKAYGFTKAYERGIHVSGILKGKVASGRVQMEDVRSQGYFIEPGFSGTAIWNEKYGGVLGIAVSADADKSIRVAFMIPTVRIRAIVAPHLQEFQSVYHPPVLKRETLLTNLVTVNTFEKRLSVATATVNSPRQILEHLHSKGVRGAPWLLKRGLIFTFEDLEQSHWTEVCDQGSIETFDTDEWAFSSDEDRLRDFVALLNLCLREKTRNDLNYDKNKDYFYFRPTSNLTNRVYTYNTGTRRTERRVFAAYETKTGPNAGTVYCYRHSAFKGQFRCYGNAWYLEITPSYHFTSDGVTVHPQSEDLLSKIKQIERNQAVMGQVRMWAYYLAPQSSLFDPVYPYLGFGQMVSFDVQFGLNDADWLSHEEDKRILEQPTDDTPLFEGL